MPLLTSPNCENSFDKALQGPFQKFSRAKTMDEILEQTDFDIISKEEKQSNDQGSQEEAQSKQHSY
ncbi:hypothetical protein HPP92_011817 [Vanilla planifolia]|uniref:Uncharacterized protein n=1 Tax=Vanilla planifolia TaxID=51239 RepID=A0A835R2J4_VANPL|nr:hypothetical protein HPP92_011817 [Vanilla planifolia]